MPARSRVKTPKQLVKENADLRVRLEEAEETLHAIRSGQVDALIVAAEQGEQVYTLKGADQPYRILIEEMSEGALTITAAGDIVYCNRRFAEMLKTPIEKLMGSSIYDRVEHAHHKGLAVLLKTKRTVRFSEEMELVAGDGMRVPVHLSIDRVAGLDEPSLFGLVVTDLTEQKRSEQIVAQEKLARSILAQALEAIIVCDEKGRIIRANAIAQALCGDDPVGLPFATSLALRLSDGTTFSLDPTLQGESRQRLEVQLERRGQTYYLLLSAAALRGTRNEMLGCVVTLTDVSERELAEHALRAAKDAAENEKQRLQAVMDALPIGVAITDAQGGNIHSNSMFDSVWGGAHPPARAVGDYVAYKARWLDTGKPVLPAEWASGQVIQKGAPVVGQLMEIERFDGALGYVINSAAPVRDAAGKIVGAAVAIQDITELRHTQDALRESEDKYRRLIENVDDLVCEVDAGARYLFVNSRYEQILGYAPEELLGKYVRELIHPDDLKQSTPSFKKLVGGGTISRNEWRFKHKNGEWRWFDCVAQTYEKTPGDPHVVVISRDITDRKKGEAELNQLNRTLRALSNINQAMMRIQDEVEFLQAVCKIIVNDCGHAMVWIGYAEQDEAKTVRPVASAGFEEGYLETLKITWADTERGRGPTGTAIRTGKPTACSNMLTDPNFKPWREEAIKRGYASSIVLPLMASGKAFGAITIYSKDPDPFSGSEVKLLSELADDLAFGVTASRLRVAHAEAEEALGRSEERYRSLFNAMTEGFALHEITCDEEGNPCDYVFLDMNPAFERLTGLKREQVIGRAKSEVLPDDDPFWVDAYGNVALTGNPVHFENYSPALQRHFEVFAYSPAPRQFAVVFSEITERKMMEEALRESEERYRQLVQFAPTGIYEVDFRTGHFTSVNDAMCQILGYSRDELLALTAFDILDAESRAHFAARIRRGQAGEQLNDAVEYRVRKKDGRIIWGLLNATFHWEGGRIVGATVVANDITERKQMEQALRSSNDNLERVVAERTAELQAANTRLRALTRDIVSTQEEERRRVSRELHDEAGQALTALKLSLQTMQADLPAGSETYCQNLGEAVALTDSTLDQIRMLAQDLRPPALDTLGLDATLEGLCKEFARRTLVRVNYVGVQLPGFTGPATICLYRFLQEALTNAARHGHATEIQVRLERDAECVCLSVKDNGQGFDTQKVLSDQGNAKSIGLIGMQERTKMVGGQLEIYFEPWPWHTLDCPRSFGGSMIRVLIAEDHHLVRQGIRALLEKSNDIQVVGEAPDGQEAVELATSLKPDVIVMDLAMPRLNGTQATEQIRAAHLPAQVVMLSMYSDETLVRQALRSGAKGYLLKRSVAEELLLAVRAAARGETFLSSTISGSILASALAQTSKVEVQSPFERLSAREKQVLKLVAEGNTNNAIAQAMEISVKTVEKHRTNLMTKLNVHDTAGLVRLALKHGLIFVDE